MAFWMMPKAMIRPRSWPDTVSGEANQKVMKEQSQADKSHRRQHRHIPVLPHDDG